LVGIEGNERPTQDYYVGGFLMRTLITFLVILVAALLCISSAAQGDWVKQGSPGIGMINTLTFVGSDLYAGAFYGLYVSHDQGVTWQSLGFSETQVLSIAASGPNLLVGLDYSEGAYLSTDGGTTWSLKVIDNATVYALKAIGSTLLAGADGDRVYRSTDNGVNWTVGIVGISGEVRTFTTRGMTIFAGTSGAPGVCKSTDDGITWTPTTNSGMWCTYTWDLAVSGNSLVAAACNGVFASTDGGENWTESLTGHGGFRCSFAVANGMVYVAACGGGFILTSQDDGFSWSDLTQRSADLYGQRALVVDGNYLYCGRANGVDAIGEVWRCPLNELSICGDVNGDGICNISDCIYTLGYIFAAGPAPATAGSGDTNADSVLNISDVVYVIAYIFANGPVPCEAH
jgi:hypothetical protein